MAEQWSECPASSVKQEMHSTPSGCLYFSRDHQYVFGSENRRISILSEEVQRQQLRSSCEACRLRKLRCSGISEDGKRCHRCEGDDLDCFFSTRSQIGRPRKQPEVTMSPQNGDTKPNMSQKRKQTMVPELATSPALVELPSPLKKDAKTAPVRTSPEPRAEPRPNSPLQSSLGDLSLAVFLESLYTLEIAASDGLTSSMLLSSGAQLENPSLTSVPQTDMFDGDATLINPFECTPNTMLYKSDTPERKSGYPESAFLRDGLAFSVPSDFSWWNTDGLAMARNTPTDVSDMTTSSNFVVPSEMVPNGAPATATSMHRHPRMPPSTGRPAGNSCCSSQGIVVKDAANTSSDVRQNVSPSTVHCVPDPSGTGCSCLCNGSVSLLSLHRSLGNNTLFANGNTGGGTDAASSLVFTLSMSQSVARQCVCSADCPTCKQNPSYKQSTGVLISTALQIYARALKVFQGVLVSDGSSICHCSSTDACATSCPCTQGCHPNLSAASSVDVRIGDFLPSARNARKIALYAMKLELYDLERALARVDFVAQGYIQQYGTSERSAARCCPNKNMDNTSSLEDMPMVNPIDQLVIGKLHDQLNEVLRTVESLESGEYPTLYK